MNKRLRIVAALATALCAGTASAEFKVVSDASEAAQPISQTQAKAFSAPAGLSQIGTPSGFQPVAKGFGKDVSLLMALKQIVPTGWTAKRSGGLDVSMPISWRGSNKTWYEVLHNLGTQYGFNAEVNWQTKELTVSPAAAIQATLAPAPAAAHETAELSSTDKVSVSYSEQPVSSPVHAAEKTFTLDTTKTLRENVQAWAEREGWHVSWAAVDYPVSIPVSFTGTFEAEGGPLHQLVEAYKTAEQPITMEVMPKNKTVRVENHSWKQAPTRDEVYGHRLGRDLVNDEWRKPDLLGR